MNRLRAQVRSGVDVRMYPDDRAWVVSDTAHTSEEVHVDRR